MSLTRSLAFSLCGNLPRRSKSLYLCRQILLPIIPVFSTDFIEKLFPIFTESLLLIKAQETLFPNVYNLWHYLPLTRLVVMWGGDVGCTFNRIRYLKTIRKLKHLNS